MFYGVVKCGSRVCTITVVTTIGNPVKLGKIRFKLGGVGGGAGLRRGGSLVIFLQIGEGQTSFILNPGRVIDFFAKEKILHVASILYIQAKLPIEFNLSYFTGVEKFTYQKTILSQLT